MIKDAENKAVKLKETKATEFEEEYFFPDIGGRAITVKAKSREEAEKKAKQLIHNNQQNI